MLMFQQQMFVVNFDFSQYSFFPKLLAINIPVILTEIVTYPLQRMQVQLIKRQPYYSQSQLKEMLLILGQMFKVQGFPKCFHGLRYSVDYAVTQMTFKFFLFDHLMIMDWADKSKYGLYLCCILANAGATFASQSAFNYQTIASSLQPSLANTTEGVKQKLVKFTENKKVFYNGLKYTIPVSIVNSLVEIILITKLQGKFLKEVVKSDNELAPVDLGYTRQQLIIAGLVLSLTSFTNHFAVQRQIELCFDSTTRFTFTKGLVGSYLRNTGKGMLLYGLYFKYFDWLMQKNIESLHEKRQVHNVLQGYNRPKPSF